MDAIQLLLFSVLLFGLGAVIALLFNRSARTARWVTGISGMLASGVGFAAAILAIVDKPPVHVFSTNLPFGNFSLEMDSLATFMVGIISVLGFAVSLYSISYLEKYEKHNLGVLGFFFNLFLGMMLLVVTVANAFFFLIMWEAMTLASYFLVTFEQDNKEAIKAGYLYMLVAHAGTALIMVSFFIYYMNTGSFDFAAFREATLSPAVRSLIFVLAFIGFGAKAGMVPLHIWMPAAYSAAPSNATALMASVMKKVAIYGILRVCVDFLGPSILWWGLLVLIFGALSALLGVLYALTEKDLKRMLAYSSVENLGIILLGIGTGMVGLAAKQPVVVLLGFLAALYHLVNHAFFKGLLFLGSGSIGKQANTKDLNQMGGLGRRMPWTALAFLAGALSIAAIPPFNGFVSEWFTYQAFFTASSSPAFIIKALAPLLAMLLAITGALAAMVFIKAYSGAFSGPARSPASSQAKEAPGTMIAGMAFLAIGCLALGLGAPIVAPYLSEVAASIPKVPALTVANSAWVYPVQTAQAVLTPPLMAVLLLGLIVVPLIIIAVYGGFKAGRREVDDPWACGYGYATQMSVSASSFDQPVKYTFRPFYTLRTAFQRPFDAIAAWSRRGREGISRAEPVLERFTAKPIAQFVQYLGQSIQKLQMGDIRTYCLYIILTLAVLLIVVFA